MFRLTMPLTYVDLDEGRPREVREVYDEWALVAQDCELAWKAIIGSPDALVELRPVLRENPPQDWGVRNQRFLLDESGAYLDNNLPRLLVTPSVVAAGVHLGCLDTASARRLKTWLGLRYDRPAIPQAYVRLADALVKQIKAKRNRSRAALIRDVLARFWAEPSEQVMYELVAVLPSDGDETDVRKDTERWLADVALAVPATLGVAVLLEARPDTEVSLSYVENSYALDATSVSWPVQAPGPVGQIGGS